MVSSGGIDFDDFYFFADKTDLCAHPDFTRTDHVPRAECEALVALYTGTNGDAWTNTGSWFGTTDVEQRFGVHTDVYNGQRHVDGLFLHKSTGGDAHSSDDPDIWIGNNLV